MKVVLLKDIAGVGKVGEIKDVSDGFVMNALLPQKKARIAKSSDLNRKHNKADVEVRIEKRDLNNKKLKSKLDGMYLTLPQKADENGHLFGSVNSSVLAKKLKEKGFEINPKFLQYKPIKQLGEHVVEIDFGERVGKAKMKISIILEK